MAPRAIASATISFGLVSIPVKVFTATSPQRVHFNMLEAKTGARVKQQYVSTVSGEVVPRSEMTKGYEYVRGQYIVLGAEELKALEVARSGHIDIQQFVPLDSVDLVQVEKSYYLGPDRGGDKAYQLLSKAMSRRTQVAVGRWAARGKEQLVLIRPYQDGLLLHQLFYATEVRAFEDIDRGAKFDLKDVEMDLADKLIEQLAQKKFNADDFEDHYTQKVRALLDQKVAGQEITAAPEQPKAQIIDLFEALKQSLEHGDTQPATPKKKPLAKAKAKPRAKAKPKAKPLKKAAPRKRATAKKKTSTG